MVLQKIVDSYEGKYCELSWIISVHIELQCILMIIGLSNNNMLSTILSPQRQEIHSVKQQFLLSFDVGVDLYRTLSIGITCQVPMHFIFIFNLYNHYKFLLNFQFYTFPLTFQLILQPYRLFNFQKTMEVQRQQYLDSFLNIVKSSRSKQDFLTRVHQFDQRFTESYPSPVYLQNKPSMESMASMQHQYKPPAPIVQQKPKNPFLSSSIDQNQMRNNFGHQPQSRTNKFLNQTAINFSSNLPAKNMEMNRSEQQFYKPKNNQFPNYLPKVDEEQYRSAGSFQNYQGYNPNQQANFNYNPQRQMNEGPYYDRDQEQLRNNFGKMYINPNQYGKINPNHMGNMGQMMGAMRNVENPRGNQNSYLKNYMHSNSQDLELQSTSNLLDGSVGMMGMDEPQYVKYYKKLVPQSNPKQFGSRPVQQPQYASRFNPFSKQ